MLEKGSVVTFVIDGQKMDYVVQYYAFGEVYYLECRGGFNSTILFALGARLRDFSEERCAGVYTETVLSYTLAGLQSLVDRLQVEVSKLKPVPTARRVLKASNFGCQTPNVQRLVGTIVRSA